MAADDVERWNESTAGASERPARYSAGFCQVGGDPLLPPYILVHAAPGRVYGLTHDTVQASLEQEFRERPDAMGWATVNRPRDQFCYQFPATAPDGGPVRGIAYGNLGSQSTVVLFAYFSRGKTESSADLQSFEKLNGSFRFDSGYTFTPPSGVPGGFDKYLEPGPHWVILFVAGIVGCLLIKSAYASY